MKLIKNSIHALGISAFIMAGMIFSSPISMASSERVISMTSGAPTIRIFLNNSQFMAPTGIPILRKGAVLIPLEGLLAAKGMVNYDKRSKVIKVNNILTVGTIKEGSKVGYINGKKIVYAAEPQRINEQLYVPLRFISDAIGGKLEWNAHEHYASIKYPEFIGDNTESGNYLLDGMSGVLYNRDDSGKIHRLGISTAKLEPGYIIGTKMTAAKVADDADLISIYHSHGEPSSNVEVYTLFIKKGKILRQSHAHYWEFVPDDIKLYKGNAVMNDGHIVRLIGVDGSVISSWNVSKLAGNPDHSYAVEALGEGYIVVRWSNEGFLTVIDLRAQKAVILFKEFGIDLKDIPGFRYDSIRFSGIGNDPTELEFTFTNRDNQAKIYTYKLGAN
ncbi:copper amine oxidase N-terminal domain-containing protein [Cohnella luojiensis]|uniref:Copper amine oxidase N-terminal domain-containing protein n=1 Tax=Cohnella luojiensis TaxID=652876 RepID=A0A4Y8LUA4_9BACL|nr:copper amine oxidase N-terminal domain-containing protein [Cohnella luojiensis]TFE25203.1 copper amine oxidase N-terminal domain-containing protein [Cohnella luojiensis]